MTRLDRVGLVRRDSHLYRHAVRVIVIPRDRREEEHALYHFPREKRMRSSMWRRSRRKSEEHEIVVGLLWDKVKVTTVTFFS